MDEKKFIQYLQRQVNTYGSTAAFCKEKGIAETYLGKVLRQKQAIGPKILEAVGFEKVVTYRRIKDV
jgi:hypothetical protein